MLTGTGRGRVVTWPLPALLLVVLFVVTTVPSASADVPKPILPQASGQRCVEETSYIRRNHMDLLMHQRDNTVQKGFRPPRHRLNGCLTCHAVKGADNQPVTIDSDKHFCNRCHSYAAVKIDCFDCHSSTPGDEKRLAGKDL